MSNKKERGKTRPPVVILCGGRGTRLKEETEWRPKPLVSIGDEPILWHIMKIYAYYGFTDFILCLGYKGEMIRDYFLNYDLKHSDIRLQLGSKKITKLTDRNPEENWSITLANTGLETMTGGRLKRVSRYIHSNSFLLTYGDGVTNLNIREVFEFHQQKGKLATVTAVRPSSRYGELSIREGLVEAFVEKPQTHEGWISGGFFVMNRQVLDLIPGDETVLESDPMQNLAREGELAVYQHDGFWQSMDTYREMELLNVLWRGGEAPWKVWK